MSDPKRLRILKAITALLQTITPSNGYNHDLSSSVVRGRAQFGVNDPVPLVTLLEAAKPSDPMYEGDFSDRYINHNWLILVQGWVTDDNVNPTDPAYLLAADVEKCLGQVVSVDDTGTPVNPGQHLLGGLIASMKIGPSVCRPPEQNVSSKAFFFLPLYLGLYLSLADPYV